MKQKPLILSLDLSTKCGWALGRDFETPTHGVWTLGKMHTGLGRIFSCLADCLEDTIRVHQPDHCIFEAPLPQQKRDTQAIARLLIGLAAVAEMICHEGGVPCCEEFPKNARQLVLGTGNATKEQIVGWCWRQGWQPSDDNAADALLLLRYKHTLDRTRIMAGAGSAA